MSYNTQLQSNNTDLQSILDIINDLPEAGSTTEPILQDKTVVPTTSEQTITADSGYDGLDTVTVEAMPTATQATPSISVSTGGLITASTTQSEGYVSAGTKSTTKQLTVQAAKTITPTTASQKAVAKNVYTTGAITVEAIPSTYIIPSGTVTITTNGTHNVASYASATVNVESSGGGSDESNWKKLIKGEDVSITSNDFNGFTSIPNYAFYQKTNLLSIVFPLSITTMGNLAFYGCTKIKSVIIPDSVTSVGTQFFSGCTGIESITLSDNLTVLNQNFCYGCSKLKSIVIPSSVTQLGTGCFYFCKALTEVIIPSALTSLGQNSFRNCTSLQKVVMESGNTKTIGTYCFNGCSALTALIIREATNLFTLSNTNVLQNTPIASGTGYIYVPSSKVDTYKAATNWSTYANQIRAIEDYPDITGG